METFLLTLSACLAAHVPRNTVEQLFAEVDHDRNGKVGFREFHMLAHSPQAQRPSSLGQQPLLQPQPQTLPQTQPHAQLLALSRPRSSSPRHVTGAAPDNAAATLAAKT